MSKEINKEVAEKVFGLKDPIIWRTYSTDIKAAWEVVRKMTGKDFLVEIKAFSVYTKVYCYGATESVSALEKSAPLAICKAALAAVEGR